VTDYSIPPCATDWAYFGSRSEEQDISVGQLLNIAGTYILLYHDSEPPALGSPSQLRQSRLAQFAPTSRIAACGVNPRARQTRQELIPDQ
jgi:hypothetical protein